jgi:hypothetical protein
MTRVSTRLFPMLLLLALSLGGCASGGERPPSTSATTLTQDDMSAVAGSNLYEVVDRLRPRWLQVRGPMSLTGAAAPQIVVFLNNAYLGGPDQLRQFMPRDVIEVRYLDGPTASATLRGYDSTIHVAGAIVLVTRER